MDNVGHQGVPRLANGHKKGYNGKRQKGGDDALKVVYISSPMKVKTSASRFRSLVQQLTGKDSDITRHNIEAEANGASDRFHEIDCDDNQVAKDPVSDHQVLSSISSEDTPTTSDSPLGAMDNHLFTPQTEEQFAGIYGLCDPSQLDVLGIYNLL